MISSRDIANEINKRLRDTWTDDEWKHGKDVEIDKAWAGRLKFITERYVSAGWIVKKRFWVNKIKEKYFFFRS